MGVRTEDRDFARFRDRGSAEALARVFDAVAPRLLLLAGHLTPDAAQAEDLVQTAFLHAMRDAQRYDDRRPVATWLAGILRNRAVDLRRRAAVRGADPLADDEGSIALDPADLVADRELFERVTDAIDGLAEPYREVLILRLVHGLEPTAIAHSLGRAPGTVRMQLKRGLERLRDVMPERSALLGALLIDPSRGLAGVREAVLAKAGSASAAAAGAGILGGLIGMKLLLSAAAAAALGVALFWFGDREDGPGRAEQVAERQNDAVLAPPTGPALAAPADDAASEQGEERTAVATEEAVALPAEDGPFTVAVVFASDGAPAVDVGVYLRATGEGGLGRELRTDEAGRASFDGLRPGLYEAHVDRMEGPQELRVEPAATRTITIPRGVLARGQVLDLDERGVAGARVFRFNTGHHDLLQEVATTDANGRFVLRDMAEEAQLVARASGFQPSELERVRDGRGLKLVLGARGHRLRGRVLDASGAPAPHAWIAIGVDEDAREDLAGAKRPPNTGAGSKPLDREAFFLRADAQGAFESDEVPGGHALVLARPLDRLSGDVGWETLWLPDDSGAEITVRLRGGAELTGTVRDDLGRPVVGVEVEAEWEGTHALGQMEDDLGPWMSDRRVRSGPDGAYRLAGLLPGDYDLRVLGARDTLARVERLIDAGAAVRWDAVVDPLATLRVRLLGPADEPVSGWSIGASAAPGMMPSSGFLTRYTDDEGRLQLPDLPPDDALELSFFPPGGLFRFPAALRSGVRPGRDELIVRLTSDELPGGSLAGRWVREDGRPHAGATIGLRREGWERTARVRTDAEGAFAFEPLSAGSYVVTAEGSGHVRGTPLGTWTLAPNQALDVGSIWLPDSARLTLVLRGADGAPLGNTAIDLEPLDFPGASLQTRWTRDGDEWTCGSVPLGEHLLRIVSSGRATHAERIQVGPGERRLERELQAGAQVTLDTALRRDTSRLQLRIWDEHGVCVVDEDVWVSFAAAAEPVSHLTARLIPGSYRARVVEAAEGIQREVAFTLGEDDLRLELDLR
ncbi:MAG: sigma-70 family RNA polymerase sigma factor [Planctomycetota bacterium]